MFMRNLKHKMIIDLVKSNLYYKYQNYRSMRVDSIIGT